MRRLPRSLVWAAATKFVYRPQNMFLQTRGAVPFGMRKIRQTLRVPPLSEGGGGGLWQHSQLTKVVSDWISTAAGVFQTAFNYAQQLKTVCAAAATTLQTLWTQGGHHKEIMSVPTCPTMLRHRCTSPGTCSGSPRTLRSSGPAPG